MHIVIAIVLALGLIKGLAVYSAHQEPAAIGVTAAGQLQPCPPSPNAVNSEDPDPKRRVEPLPYHGTPEQTRAAFTRFVSAQPRFSLKAQTPDYLHYEASSFLFGFVDDVEFRFVDDQRLIQCRSASRVGHSDLGANRKRLDKLRTAWAEQPLP